MSLLAHFAAILVATNTPAPHPQAAKIELAAKLTRAKSPKIAERACTVDWERDTDGWWSCVVGLESWRCEVQGWCGTEGDVVGRMPLPDTSFAGSVDWDAI